MKIKERKRKGKKNKLGTKKKLEDKEMEGKYKHTYLKEKSKRNLNLFFLLKRCRYERNKQDSIDSKDLPKVLKTEMNKSRQKQKQKR